MALLSKIFLYFITDKDGRCKYVENGIVKTSSPPVPLPQHPKGWKDIKISFGTNNKYFSLNRAFTVPMFFVGDGATICREAIYAKKGYEEELYIVILKLNPDNGIHELEYKGRLDFGKYSDEPRKGITVNSIEGGVLQYLNNNDDVQYEIPLDVTNPDCIQLLFDGVNLFDRLRYSTINIALQALPGIPSALNHMTLPLPFISNEGDSYGIVNGGQILDVFTDPATYVANSANCILYSTKPVDVNVSGTIKFRLTRDSYPTGDLAVFFITTNQNLTPPIPPGPLILYYQGGLAGPTDVVINVGQTISLAANEKLFLMVGFYDVGAQHLTYNSLETDLFFSFTTRNDPSKAYAIQPLYLWRELILRATEGRFTGDSAFFALTKNLVMTSTNALRNLAYNYYTGPFETIDTAGVYTIKIPSILANFPQGSQLIISGAASNNGAFTVVSTSLATLGYTIITVVEVLTNATIEGSISTAASIKMSIQDFYNDYDCDYLLGLRQLDNVLYIEPIADLYKPDAEIFDIGEISDLKLMYAFDMLCNTAKFGSKSQDYRQRNGRYEFNTTTEFKLPVDTLKKEYNKITKSRRDCYGIEFIRALLVNRPTTDVTGDNQAFMVDVVPGATYVYYRGLFDTADVGGGVYNITIPRFLLLLNPGDLISITGDITVSGAVVISAYGATTTVIQITAALATASLVNGVITVTDPNVYSVNRPNYDSIIGVPDNTVFNTEITPHHQMLAHGRMFNSIMHQLPADKIAFRTADKNADLVLTYPGGRVLAQKQDEVISTLGDPLFFPFYAQFRTKVPLTFAKIMAGLGTGYVKGTYIGVPIYFLPIGKMDAKPANNEAQEWEMILAATNDLSIIQMLSSEGEFSIDTMGNFIFTSDLNPLHFVKYNYALPPKYKYKDMYDDQQQNRNDRYVGKPFYKQKWQTTEKIHIQCITKGLATIDVTVYDANGDSYFTTPMTVTADPAVRTPNVRWDHLLDITAFPAGYYIVVLSADGVNLRISEWLDIKASHPGTLLFDYSHTTNKYKFYWNGIAKPCIRVEATLLKEYVDSSFTEYTDELANNEMLDGIPVMKQMMRLGNGAGVPEWMANKINRILLLNRTFLENKHYTRTTESKFAKKEIVGWPFYSYMVEMIKAAGTNGLSTDETGSVEDFVVAATLDAQGFGIATPGEVIDIEFTVNP